MYLRPAWAEAAPQATSSSITTTTSSTAASNGHQPSTSSSLQQQLSELRINEADQQQQNRQRLSQQQQEQELSPSSRDAASAVPSRMAALAGTAAAAGGSQTSLRLQLINLLTKSDRPPSTNVVNVYTNDGEWFPVKKKLLRPCISLTQVRRMCCMFKSLTIGSAKCGLQIAELLATHFTEIIVSIWSAVLVGCECKSNCWLQNEGGIMWRWWEDSLR